MPQVILVFDHVYLNVLEPVSDFARLVLSRSYKFHLLPICYMPFVLIL